MDLDDVLARLRSMGSSRNREGMARFGINVESAVGVSVTVLRKVARDLGRDHRLAAGLWKSGVHEARILAALTDEPGKVTPAQMDRWVRAFDSWDLCDLVCANLFDRTPFAYGKAVEWAERDEEFVKRAGFALMAALAWHDKEADDEDLAAFLPTIGSRPGTRARLAGSLATLSANSVARRSSPASSPTSRPAVRDPDRSLTRHRRSRDTGFRHTFHRKDPIRRRG